MKKYIEIAIISSVLALTSNAQHDNTMKAALGNCTINDNLIKSNIA